MKFIKLFAGTLPVAEAAANKFIADNDPATEFIEARPYGGGAGQDAGVLICLQYEADEEIKDEQAGTLGE